MIRRFFTGFFLIVTIIVLIPLLYLTFGENRPIKNTVWGVSFSPLTAESLGLDWKKVYLSALDDLKVTNLRLNAYWDNIEPSEGRYNFDDLDFMINQASLRDRKIILAIGRRLPRWPECHIPQWVQSLAIQQQNEKVLEQIQKVIERYRTNPHITAWQVENEYFVTWFGNCPPPDSDFFETEIMRVRSLDNRPIVVTDTGEFSLWFKAASYGDIFGTTMYRRGYAPVIGPADWQLPPVYYSRLGKLVKFFTGFKRLIVAELQMEPWAKTTVQNDSTEENYKTLSPLQFQKNISFARNSGIEEVYMWGMEWWYYMKEKRGIDTFWEQAKGLWNK